AVMRGNRQRDAGIDARELLDADAVVDRRHRGAAVLLRELDAHEPELRELGDELGRKMLRLVPLADVRPHLGLGEVAHRAAQQRLLFRRTEVHNRSMYHRDSYWLLVVGLSAVARRSFTASEGGLFVARRATL